MTAMTFDSPEPSYTPVGSNESVFGNTSTFERLQHRKSSNSKMPLILAGVVVVAGLGAYAASELMSTTPAEPAPVSAPVARVAPATAAPPAEIVAATPAPAPAATVQAPAPAPVTRQVAERPAPRSVRPAPRAAAEPAPADSAAAPPVLTLPPASTDAAPAPASITIPPPINPDPGAAIQ